MPWEGGMVERRVWAHVFLQGLDRDGSARGRGGFVKGTDIIAVPSPPETSVKYSLATFGISSVK